MVIMDTFPAMVTTYTKVPEVAHCTTYIYSICVIKRLRVKGSDPNGAKRFSLLHTCPAWLACMACDEENFTFTFIYYLFQNENYLI